MKRIALSLVMIVTALAALADIYVVSSEKALVYEADDESAETIGSLRRDMEINVMKVEAGFCEIDFMGVKAYVLINDLKFKSRSDKGGSHEDGQNLGEKTKDFVKGTSKKVASGVSGLKNKLFGKKKSNKQKTEDEEDADVDADIEDEPVQQERPAQVAQVAQAAPESAAAGVRKGAERENITAADYRAAVADAAAHASEVTEEGAAGVIYIFDNHKYICNQLVRFNGNLLPLPDLEVLKKGNSLTTYKRAVTKIVVKNPERIILTRDFIWCEKPFHDELTLDVADGDVYYVELVSGFHNRLNLLDNKKGVKELEKVKKDKKNWNVNPDQYYDK